MAVAWMLRNASFLKVFSISGGFEYPEKLGNALAHKVFKLFRTFLGHPGGAAGPASRPPWAAQGGVRLFFSRAGVKNPHVRIFHARPAGPGRREDISFTAGHEKSSREDLSAPAGRPRTA